MTPHFFLGGGHGDWTDHVNGKGVSYPKGEDRTRGFSAQHICTSAGTSRCGSWSHMLRTSWTVRSALLEVVRLSSQVS